MGGEGWFLGCVCWGGSSYDVVGVVGQVGQMLCKWSRSRRTWRLAAGTSYDVAVGHGVWVPGTVPLVDNRDWRRVSRFACDTMRRGGGRTKGASGRPGCIGVSGSKVSNVGKEHLVSSPVFGNCRRVQKRILMSGEGSSSQRRGKWGSREAGRSEKFLGRGTMVGAIVRFWVGISRESLHLGQAGAGEGDCGTCVTFPQRSGAWTTDTENVCLRRSKLTQRGAGRPPCGSSL